MSATEDPRNALGKKAARGRENLKEVEKMQPEDGGREGGRVDVTNDLC